MPRIVVVLLLGLLAAAPAHATPARSLALGAGDLLEDQAAVFRWPGSARDHAGRLWLDGGAIDPGEGWSSPGDLPRTGPALAVAWGAGPGGWTGAFAVHARAADADHVGLHRDGPGAAFSWLAGRALGPVDVAATWRSVVGGWSSDDDASDEFEHHRDDFGLGARLDLSSRAYLDLAGDLRHQRNRQQAPGTEPAWDTGGIASSRSWSARARAFVALSGRTVLSVAGERLREDFAGPVRGEDWDAGAMLAQDNRLWSLGAGLAFLPDPDRLFTVGVGYADLAARARVLAGEPAGPAAAAVRVATCHVAAEQRLNWWLSLRGSLAVADVARDGAARARRADAAAGLGFHFGAWGLDATAGSAPLPAPWRWLAGEDTGDLRLHATIHRDF